MEDSERTHKITQEKELLNPHWLTLYIVHRLVYRANFHISFTCNAFHGLQRNATAFTNK